MKSSVTAAALLAAALFLAGGPGSPPAGGQGARAGSVRIGLIGTLFRDTPEALVQVIMRPFKVLLEAQTGVTGNLVVAGEAADLGCRLKEDKVQLGVFHGTEFAWARVKYPTLQPLLIAVNRHRSLHAHLVVRQDCKAATHRDLRGQPVALPVLSREHCRLYFERRCVKPGVAPANFFARVTAPPDPEEALDDVVDGKVQATVVDGVALEDYRKFKPARARQLRSLQISEPFPAAVLAYQPGRLDPATARRIRAGLVAAKDNRRGRQLLGMLRITAFEAVPLGYDRQLTQTAKAYPPPAR